jgi:hypothetical protein
MSKWSSDTEKLLALGGFAIRQKAILSKWHSPTLNNLGTNSLKNIIRPQPRRLGCRESPGQRGEATLTRDRALLISGDSLRVFGPATSHSSALSACGKSLTTSHERGERVRR